MIVTNSRRPDPETGLESQFEGKVELRKAIEGDQTGDVRIYLVSFHEGGRTHWHAHTGEQILYVVEGHGHVQKRGEAVQNIWPEDIVYVAPGEEHWHGATHDSRMGHIAVTAGKTNWMEEVDDPSAEQS